ncbi:MAG: hypothetical protein WBP81_35400, partial [Solirubrobacteraceae bacterium]
MPNTSYLLEPQLQLTGLGSQGTKGSAVYKLLPTLVVVAILAGAGCGSSGRALVADRSDSLLLGDQNVQVVAGHNARGRAEAFQFMARRSGRVTHADVYIGRASRAARLVVGIYGAAPGRGRDRPGALLTSGSVGRLKDGRWNNVPLRLAHLIRGLRYWIALLGVRGRVSFRDTPAGTTSYTSKQDHLTALP